MAEITEKPLIAGRRSPERRRSPAQATLRQYGYAIAAVALAFALRGALTPILHDRMPFLFFIPAVLAAAAFGRFVHGVLATGLGLLLGSLFMRDFPPFTPGEMVNVAGFAVVGLATAWGVAQLHRAREQPA